MTQYGIIWDMDGVLIDTGDYHYRAWHEVLTDFGIFFPREQFDATFGMNNPTLIRLLLGRPSEPDLIQTIGDRKETIFRNLIQDDAEPMPGVLAWLQRIQDSGYPQAIASSAPQDSIEMLVDAMGVRKYFSTMVSGVAMPGKPEPDVFLEAARLISTPPDRCLVIEDAAVGVEGAKKAGMKCIAVTTTLPAHKLAHADIVVDSLTELPENAIHRLLT
jgi:HAD superfamily hydrolase (TIGR01509 family)